MALEVRVLLSYHDFRDSPDELNKISTSIGAQVYFTDAIKITSSKHTSDGLLEA